jgi:hypothetical protein
MTKNLDKKIHEIDYSDLHKERKRYLNYIMSQIFYKID